MKTKPNELTEILDKAIDREDKARRFYLQAADKTKDKDGERMFRWLAGEELKHFDKLSQQREVLARGGQWKKMPTEPPITTSDLPRAPEADGPVKADSGEIEALQLGITAEKESVALYARAEALSTSPEAKELFGRLVQEEGGHLVLLEEELEWIKNSRQYFTLHRFALPPR